MAGLSSILPTLCDLTTTPNDDESEMANESEETPAVKVKTETEDPKHKGDVSKDGDVSKEDGSKNNGSKDDGSKDDGSKGDSNKDNGSPGEDSKGKDDHAQGK